MFKIPFGIAGKQKAHVIILNMENDGVVIGVVFDRYRGKNMDDGIADGKTNFSAISNVLICNIFFFYYLYFIN